MKNKLQVLKTAMAFKQLNDTGAFALLNVKVEEGYEQFAEDVETLTDIFMEHDIATIFDLVETEEELDEIMSGFEYQSATEDDEEKCPCTSCCAEDERDEDAKDSGDVFERTFKLKTAEAILGLIDLGENLSSNMDNLKKENSDIKKALNMLVQYLENNEKEN